MEAIVVNVELIIFLRNKQEWINKIPRALKRESKNDKYLFVDSENNVLTCGEDFSVAELKNTYPVRVYRLIRVAECRTSIPSPQNTH